MKTVELSAALGQAQVVENLKNFVGVDAQGAAALMTPERLAAVAGGKLGIIHGRAKIKSKGTFDTDIKKPGIFLCQNAYSESDICVAVMYDTTDGVVIHATINVSFFKKGDNILSVYRENPYKGIVLYNNHPTDEITVPYTFISCMSI